jgi:putative nucleotidyltransferase with HDIG domain
LYIRCVTTVAEARRLAAGHLGSELPQRWVHVQAVAAVAAEVAVALALDADALVASAWLHDIGYAREAASTGFHALDGARFLRGLEMDERVVCLVAHHSCAAVEAAKRGLDEALAVEFPREQSETADALWYADMTTGPDGARVSVEERLEEISGRYGPGDVVTDALAVAAGELVAAVRRTEARLRAAGALV